MLGFRWVALIVGVTVAAALGTTVLRAQGGGPADSGRVSGRVRGPSGTAAVGVTIILEGTSYITTSNATGGFTLSRIPAGTYTLLVQGVTLRSHRVNVRVLPGRDTRVDVALSEADGVEDSGAVQHLPPVVVTAPAPLPPALHLPDIRGTEIYSGKKTQVVHLDSLTVATAQNVTRDLYGSVPGANISETQSSGFPSNGIAFRGLNPVQSVEMNTRQDGVNIVADLYGYPETYYTPPAQALERAEFVRGSSSLQFGPQFGGVVNYVLRDGKPNMAPMFTLDQTGGSYGLFSSYLSLAGGAGRWTYFAYGQYRSEEGWRPNADLSQVSAAGRVHYQASTRVRLGLEYSLLRNNIHMPGGLDNAAFNSDPQQSLRARNWLASPWNIVAASADIDLGQETQLTSVVSFMASQRYLVWRNEDGGPSAADSIDPATLEYTPREVEWEYFYNLTSDTRLRTSYHFLGGTHTLATGFRVFTGTLHRQEGGVGTTGSDFDMQLVEPYETDVRFGTGNAAAFAENVFQLGPRLAITPGVRLEYLHSTADGHTDTTFVPQAKDRTFALAGVGARYHASATTDVYANLTQAYRPIEYSFLTPFASGTRVDPNLRDPKGYNADIGWRGSLGESVTIDIGAFYLAYHDRIGLVSGVDSNGVAYTERTNVANSVHKGVESYIEVRPFTLFGLPAGWGALRVSEALGYTHARYTTGDFAGDHVEYAPEVVSRLNVSYGLGRTSTALLWSSVSDQFTDANNTVMSGDANVGIVPAYQLLDWSAEYRFSSRTRLGVGVTNVANNHYLTLRTTEYPGPGIIPGLARTAYVTIRVGM